MVRRPFVGLALASLTLLASCARLPDTGVTTLKPEPLVKLQVHLLDRKPDLDQFRLRGPYEVTVQDDREIRLSADERIEADFYLSAVPGKAPLVIIVHGQDNSKEDHGYQALHLASWGMHGLSVQLPNNGPWVRNGETLAEIVHLLHRRPDLIDSHIDPNKIILAGHSFGGTAVAIALAQGAPAVGGILLDPAGIGKALPTYLKRIRAPVMVIASDWNVSEARNRGDFYEYVPSDIAEVSITGAHHEDAQFPIEPSVQGFGTDSAATEEMQITFVSALTSAAFSLASTGKLDYVWTSFGAAIRSGKLYDSLRK